MRILLVEDGKEDLEAFESSLKVFKTKTKKTIDVTRCESLTDALDSVDGNYDGAIVDLKLDGADGDGNTVIRKIHDNYRIPIIVLTGTPENVDKDLENIVVHKKGEKNYEEILHDLLATFDTGLTKIVGGRGVLEQRMSQVFWQNVLPQVEAWKKHAAGPVDTEPALLRLFVSHLLEFLDDSPEVTFPEEAYISPPIADRIKTGSIVKNKHTNRTHIVLSPACDIAPHNGDIKTDRFLVCEVSRHSKDSELKGAIKKAKLVVNDDDPEKEDKERKMGAGKSKLSQLMRNRYANYYHYLPKADCFEGGLICFRKVSTFKKKDFFETFEAAEIQVAAPFVKDIVARFSAFYARQGQPDFDFDALLTDLTET